MTLVVISRLRVNSSYNFVTFMGIGKRNIYYHILLKTFVNIGEKGIFHFDNMEKGTLNFVSMFG